MIKIWACLFSKLSYRAKAKKSVYTSNLFLQKRISSFALTQNHNQNKYTNYQLPNTNYQIPITNYQLLNTNYYYDKHSKYF